MVPSVRMSSVVAGPFFAVAALLGVAGLVKLVRPSGTVRALHEADLAGSPLVARALGALEVSVATAALVLGSRPMALLVVASYLAFAAFTMRLIARQGGAAGCGCFGESETPASTLHAALNLAMAATAALAAVAPPGGLPGVVAGQPLGGVPFPLLVALCTWLAYVAFTALPDLVAAVADGGGPDERAA